MPEQPLCKCHDEPMSWNKDLRGTDCGYWRCTVKKRAANRRFDQKNPERHMAWRKNNPEKERERNARRMYAGAMYLGTCGFTKQEREDMLNGETQ